MNSSSKKWTVLVLLTATVSYIHRTVSKEMRWLSASMLSLLVSWCPSADKPNVFFVRLLLQLDCTALHTVRQTWKTDLACGGPRVPPAHFSSSFSLLSTYNQAGEARCLASADPPICVTPVLDLRKQTVSLQCFIQPTALCHQRWSILMLSCVKLKKIYDK